MSDIPDRKETALIPTGITALTTRSSALVKRGLETLTSVEGRIVRFPVDCSMGALYIRPLGDEWEEYEEWGEASGNVVVPHGKILHLHVSAEVAIDLSPLTSLNFDDLQELDLSE